MKKVIFTLGMVLVMLFSGANVVKADEGLTFDMGDGITTTLPLNSDGNTIYVPSDKNYTFTVFSDKEIDVTTNRSSNPTDGIKIEKDKTQNNAYLVTIQGVQSSFSVKVVQKIDLRGAGDGTTKNDGVSTVAVWGSKGTLYINAATPGTISIYNITGQLYKTESVSGNCTLSIPKGLYFVQFNGKTYKVVL